MAMMVSILATSSAHAGEGGSSGGGGDVITENGQTHLADRKMDPAAEQTAFHCPEGTRKAGWR